MFSSLNLLTLIAVESRFCEQNCLLYKAGDLVAVHITYSRVITNVIIIEISVFCYKLITSKMGNKRNRQKKFKMSVDRKNVLHDVLVVEDPKTVSAAKLCASTSDEEVEGLGNGYRIYGNGINCRLSYPASSCVCKMCGGSLELVEYCDQRKGWCLCEIVNIVHNMNKYSVLFTIYIH